MSSQTLEGARNRVAVGRRGKLALTLEDVLTVISRLRSGGQIPPDAESFRASVKHLLDRSASEASAAGYDERAITMAGFAVIAFLDETALNTQHPVFRDWQQRPLQEEIFEGFLGGEIFFTNLEELLRGRDSETVGDVLEVHLLCLLLGFRGRFREDQQGDLDAIKRATADKLVRIRGAGGDLSPSWDLPPGDSLPQVRDRVTRTLAIALSALVGLFVIFWAGFAWSLRA